MELRNRTDASSAPARSTPRRDDHDPAPAISRPSNPISWICSSCIPTASGDFTGLLNDITFAAKIISREVNKAGLVEDILGATGDENVQGEVVQKLDDSPTTSS